MGSQSSLPERENSEKDIPLSQLSVFSISDNTAKQISHDARPSSPASRPHHHSSNLQAVASANPITASPTMSNDQNGSDAEDFGALEMFDSNASSMPYSSQAPEAVMTSPKRKRDRKSRKNKHAGAPSSSAANGNSAEYDMPDVDDAAEAIIGSSPPSKKRRHSNSNDANGRKKRKAHKDNSGADAFLRRKDRETTPDSTAEAIASQLSPSMARVRRQSQTQNAEDGANEDIDGVRALAREAWMEHVNGTRNAAAHADSTVPDSQPADENQVEAESANRRSRTSRQKKAKPTYFEQPLVDEDDDKENERRLAAGDMPSPSASSPKPRNRKQRAAPKKTPKRQQQRKNKLAHSMHGQGDEDDVYGQTPGKQAGDYKQGKFSTDELDRIDRAIESFRAEHGYEKSHVNSMIQAPGGTSAGPEHAQLWTRIFAECENRHRQKIINVCRKKHHNFVARGTWTRDQDIELAELINIKGTKWSKIAEVINRHPEDVRDRYRNYLICGPSQRKEAWDEAEEARLTQVVIDAMHQIDRMRQEEPSLNVHRAYEELIDWQLVSEQMDRTRSRLQCITKWKSMNLRGVHGKDKLKSSDPDSQISFTLEKARRQIEDMPEEEQYRFVLAIQDSAAGVDSKIPWIRLVDKVFRQSYHRTTQVLLWSRLRQSVPGWDTKTTRDCAQYLVSYYNHEGKLPDVTGEGFDDNAEMALLAEIKTEARGKNEDGPPSRIISADRIDNSDFEEDEEPSEMQIDPALSEVPKSSKKATPSAKRTLNGKKPSGRKPKRPVEDIEDEEEEEEEEEQEESEPEEEEVSRKKSKKSSKKNKKKEVQQPQSDSEMDDMDDIPAK